MRVLVLGANGMLGNAVMRIMSEQGQCVVYGTIRGAYTPKYMENIKANILTGVDVEKHDNLAAAFSRSKPNVVINCIGVIKQLAAANNPLEILPLNSILPHRIAKLCELTGARLIHISTDCVFNGSKGNYIESDIANAEDLYGRSKLLGEVAYPYSVTLRTSIIGHEMNSKNGLVEWFLAQEGECKGYKKAIFSGFPTVVLARIIRDYVITNTNLTGLYHVASDPISKFDLLQLINERYCRNTSIIPDVEVSIDRSLNSERFNQETGFKTPTWAELVNEMYVFNRE